MNQFYINGEEVSKATAHSYRRAAVQATRQYYGEDTDNAALADEVLTLQLGSKHLTDEQLEALENVTGILADGALEIIRDSE